MTDAEYLSVTKEAIMLGRRIRELPLGEAIQRINRAETVASIIDPTLFMKAQNNLSAIKQLIAAMIPIQKAAEELENAVLETMARG